MLVAPWLQNLFAPKLVGVTMPRIAMRTAAVAAAALEFTWKWVARPLTGVSVAAELRLQRLWPVVQLHSPLKGCISATSSLISPYIHY